MISVGAVLVVARPAEAERCGPNNCSGDERCCNEGCGICGPPGAICVDLFCSWGRPHYLASERLPTPDIYSRLFSAVAVGGGDYRIDNDDASASGMSAIAGVQS